MESAKPSQNSPLGLELDATSSAYLDRVKKDYIDNLLESTEAGWIGPRYQGKVRDVYERGDDLVLVATDRQSAFDISWCSIPLKGQVLTQISAWWFERIKDLVPTHLIAAPDPNAVVAKKLKMFPVEIVVRAYLTGTTETSVWVNYDRGVRTFCGNPLPDGMCRNQPLPEIIITPTTKAAEDELIDARQVVERGLASEDEWRQISAAALELFRYGQRVASERGLILVDTKYEFGRDREGRITVGDEVHTPDSSRYWIASSYNRRFEAGEEPESLDKEFFRRWLVAEGFNPKDRHNSRMPVITDKVRAALSVKYIELYERVTGEKFKFPGTEPIAERINQNLKRYFGENFRGNSK